MAITTKTATGQKNRMLDALTARLNNGFLQIWSGAQPSDADQPVPGGAVLLWEGRFAASAFNAASGGVAVAKAMASSTIKASGTAGWCRSLESDKTTVVQDGSVGVSDANLVVPTLSFVALVSLTISAYTIPMPT